MSEIVNKLRRNYTRVKEEKKKTEILEDRKQNKKIDFANKKTIRTVFTRGIVVRKSYG